MRNILFLFFFCGLFFVSAQSQSPFFLDTNQEAKRSLPGKEAHLYRITLAAGEHGRVELQADTGRFCLTLLSDTNRLITAISEADAPGLKRLNIVADRPTTFFIRVAREDQQPSSAVYRLTLSDKRPATATDQEWFALHKLDWEAISLYRQQEKTALRQAADKFRAAATRWLALGESERAGRMLDRAGRSLTLISENQPAQTAFEQAISLFKKAGVQQAEANGLGNIAFLHFLQDNYSAMLSTYVQAISIWQRTQDQAGLKLGLFKQAFASHYSGEWQRAEDLCRQLLPEAETGRVDEWERVYREDILAIRGMAAVERGEIQQGINYLTEALTQFRGGSFEYLHAEILRYLGKAWSKRGNQTKALAYLQQSQARYQRLGLTVGESLVLNELGQAYMRLNRYKEARTSLTRAVDLAANHKRAYLFAKFSLARLQHDQGEIKAALTSIEQGSQVGEDILRQIPVDLARIGIQAQLHAAQELGIDLLLHLHEQNPTANYDTMALHAAEAVRSRSLRQLLNEKQLPPPNASDSILTTQINQARQKIAALTNEKIRLRPSVATDLRAAVERELTTSLAGLERTIVEQRNNDPYAGTVAMPTALTRQEIQQQILDPDSLLLEYQLGAERSFLFAVTHDAFYTFTLPKRAVIEATARQVYETSARIQQPQNFSNAAQKQAWLQKNERAYLQAAAQLSAMILAPANTLLTKKRLLIAPDEVLHYVSFAALPEPLAKQATRTNKKSQSGNQPLVLRHEIVSLFSASTLATSRREGARQQPAQKMLMVFADPVFDKQDDRLVTNKIALTLTPPAIAQQEQMRAFSFVNKKGEIYIPRLSATRQEAEAILALLPPDAGNAAFGFDANYQAIAHGNLDQYRYIHFATHGLLDEVHPELSGLLLSQINHEGKSENGYFTTLDAFNLKLSAELVVLSGCHTALGKEIKGEGLIGLTRGFMYAGAKRVLASLWQVNDTATAELMQRFYQHLWGANKLPPAAALRAAQIEMIQTKRWNAPYYWAAFTMQGDW